MEISTREAGNATVVDITGDITLYNSPEVRRVLLDLLKAKRVPRVGDNHSTLGLGALRARGRTIQSTGSAEVGGAVLRCAGLPRPAQRSEGAS